MLDRTGLEAVVGAGARHALGPVPHEPALASADAAERAARLAFLERCLDWAADAGVSVVTAHSGPLPEGQDPREGWKHFREGMERAASRARERGLVFALEWHPAMLVGSFADWQRAAHEVPGLALALDVGHAQCTEEGPLPAFVASVAPLAAYIQLEDIRGRRHVHLPIGEGEIPFGAVFAALDRAGYAGLVTAEFHSGAIERDEGELCKETKRKLES